MNSCEKGGAVLDVSGHPGVKGGVKVINEVIHSLRALTSRKL